MGLQAFGLEAPFLLLDILRSALVTYNADFSLLVHIAFCVNNV
ncbi:hypothetical protein HMPREF1584_00807 [Gardnerella vaginalis JCP8481A]|nr:hypothetical protein HMPREF1584_00807 [Gardnerella vaginalis JCP8481A]EPI42806.1 hypothetical protein HMPREF1585_00682 [Gardnerella vaginalis JCP8481B]